MAPSTPSSTSGSPIPGTSRPRGRPPLKRPRSSSTPATSTPDVVDVQRERQLSKRRFWDVIDQLPDKYRMSIHEDDLVDFATLEIVEDRGVSRAKLGGVSDVSDQSEDNTPTDEEDDFDELDLLASAEQSLRPADSADEEHDDLLAEFLEAERLRKEECGEVDEEEESYFEQEEQEKEAEYQQETPAPPHLDDDEESDDELDSWGVIDESNIVRRVSRPQEEQQDEPARSPTPVPLPSPKNTPIQLATPPQSRTSSVEEPVYTQTIPKGSPLFVKHSSPTKGRRSAPATPSPSTPAKSGPPSRTSDRRSPVPRPQVEVREPLRSDRKGKGKLVEPFEEVISSPEPDVRRSPPRRARQPSASRRTPPPSLDEGSSRQTEPRARKRKRHSSSSDEDDMTSYEFPTLYPTPHDPRAMQFFTQLMAQAFFAMSAVLPPPSRRGRRSSDDYGPPSSEDIAPPYSLPSTPRQPHTRPYVHGSGATLPPSSPPPISPSPIRPALVARSRSRGRRVSFSFDARQDEWSPPSPTKSSSVKRRNGKESDEDPRQDIPRGRPPNRAQTPGPSSSSKSQTRR
ncbi:hypothetical protein C8F01DRAFT_258058 [Mycena amicta]|nr:hypothetical protein C8F01DRAFT_258058 [Mycena amicta]